ncbi:protein of unknown function DUF1725 containing protein [Cricetulus griseus]|nr:protein of unknown function DUF1725 containing protein [Cricetulus griseus]
MTQMRHKEDIRRGDSTYLIKLYSSSCNCEMIRIDYDAYCLIQSQRFHYISTYGTTAPRCPSTEEWMEKMWSIYTVEYYSGGKKNNGVLKFTGKWMELEETILSDITQSQKDKHAFKHRV